MKGMDGKKVAAGTAGVAAVAGGGLVGGDMARVSKNEEGKPKPRYGL